MNELPAISRKELKSISGSVRDEGQTIVPFTNENGETVMISKSQLLSALIWKEAMPFDPDTGEYKLGSGRYVDMIHSCDKKDEDGSIDALTKALEGISLKMSQSIPETVDAEFEIKNAEQAQDAEIIREENADTES